MTTPRIHQLKTIPSPLGNIWLAASDAGLRGIWFEGQKHWPDFSNDSLWRRGEHRINDLAAQWLDAYFKQPQSADAITLPLDLSSGTAFQQSVWQALLRIPLGSTIGYGELAKQLGKPDATRAAAAAVGRNPLSLIVPCHRVIGKDGSLTGYAGGLERKQWLLQLEDALR